MNTKNINVVVDEELYWELRAKASESKMDFHNYIKTIFQKEVQK